MRGRKWTSRTCKSAEGESLTTMCAKEAKPAKPGKGAKAAKGQDQGKASKKAKPKGPIPIPRLQERYRQEILPALGEKLGRKNRLSLPRLKKITINMGVGSALQDKKHLDEAVDALTLLSGQKPVVTLARKSIAGFKLREGNAIGCKVTLRGKRMYEFLDRLVSVAIPRVRDFRGLSPSAFDGHGNYSLGLTEQLVFPELNPDKYGRPQGMNITLVTSTDSDDEARMLLRDFGVPMRST